MKKFIRRGGQFRFSGIFLTFFSQSACGFHASLWDGVFKGFGLEFGRHIITASELKNCYFCAIHHS